MAEIPKIKGLPRGWKVIAFFQSPTSDRDATVLCERDPHDEFDCNFVSWNVNMIEGGCFLGMYFYVEGAARSAFTHRKMQLEGKA